MHTPEMVVRFLNGNIGLSFCDPCIQDSCALECEAKVALVATTLALFPDYGRAVCRCSRCSSRNRMATRAI